MAEPIRLRIILGVDDARKLILPAGISDSIEQLRQEIKTNFGVQQDFHLQYQDPDFGNDFVNLTAISEVNDKATLKVVYLNTLDQTQRPGLC